MFKGKFGDIVQKKDGFLRGPFGSALKKSLFVPKGEDTYKVYEQGVVLEQNKDIGKYYITKDYFDNSMSRFEVKSGDFLVSCSGVNYGAIYQLEGEIQKGVINQALLRIRINEKLVDKDYFLYYFRVYIVKAIVGGTGDSTIPNFPPMSVIKNIDVELPDIEIQRKIGRFLKEIDSKINLNNKINTELESIAKTLYDYWFLQFEFPNEEGKPYKSSGGKMVWNEELKREIPEGWEVLTIHDILGEKKGGDWGKEKKEGNYTREVICIRGADFPAICGNGKLNAPKRFILEKNSSKILRADDLIVEISGGSPTQSTGRICYINETLLKRFDTDIITSNFCRAFNLKDKVLLYWFYLSWCKMYESDVLFQYEGKTTGIKNLLFEMLCTDYKLVIPKQNVIELFNKNVKNYFDKIQKNQLENQQLESLRDFLLPLLMNGQAGFKE